MEFAKISRATDDIGLGEWSELIAKFEWLEALPDRTMKNPFTGEEIFAPGIGKAIFIQDGSGVGSAALEDGAVLTTGIPVSFCDEIAACLSANVEEDDRS